MGGMGFPNMGGMNPQQVQQMMNNPFMQRMMTEMLSDPQMLDQLINSNPMLQQMTQSNPMLRTMLSNPQFIQHVMQLQGMMNQSQGGTNTSSTTGGNVFLKCQIHSYLAIHGWVDKCQQQLPIHNLHESDLPHSFLNSKKWAF
ncbi:hypothetical protein FDP41_009439 [Naegleria fowleri]|uniref:STI1 domain-containing protein n=1 Tax=Naegleria fowleri TaxID=5763 RepID=A0A6A5BCW4_NAEFO|nr:uncharacterized protein FDP41_009439 [Naegleria fowleri]KAF0972536.1 hypothetical protein FDP41_009439 [Naegleria fowleri]